MKQRGTVERSLHDALPSWAPLPFGTNAIQMDGNDRIWRVCLHTLLFIIVHHP